GRRNLQRLKRARAGEAVVRPQVVLGGVTRSNPLEGLDRGLRSASGEGAQDEEVARRASAQRYVPDGVDASEAATGGNRARAVRLRIEAVSGHSTLEEPEPDVGVAVVGE